MKDSSQTIVISERIEPLVETAAKLSGKIHFKAAVAAVDIGLGAILSGRYRINKTSGAVRDTSGRLIRLPERMKSAIHTASLILHTGESEAAFIALVYGLGIMVPSAEAELRGYHASFVRVKQKHRPRPQPVKADVKPPADKAPEPESKPEPEPEQKPKPEPEAIVTPPAPEASRAVPELVAIPPKSAFLPRGIILPPVIRMDHRIRCSCGTWFDVSDVVYKATKSSGRTFHCKKCAKDSRPVQAVVA